MSACQEGERLPEEPVSHGLTPEEPFYLPPRGVGELTELLSCFGGQNLPARGSKATAGTGGVTEVRTRDFGK